MKLETSRLLTALADLWPAADLSALTQRLSGRETLELAMDSREVSTESLFIGVPGVSVDGRSFIGDALEAGAVGVLTELEGLSASWQARDQVLALDGLSHQLAALGRRLFAVPETLTLIGVTGTNGKSSVTHYIAALLEAMGQSAGVIGTLGYGSLDAIKPARQTTPGPLALQQMLGEMAAQSIDTVAMEVSSHALEQERLGDSRIDVAVFTNLSRDHLDYHGSMAAYAAAKAKLFKRSTLKLAIVNGEDPLARLMLAGLAPNVRVLASGSAEATTLRVVGCEMRPAGLHAVIASPEDEHILELALMGRFNLDNALLAMTTLYGLGYSLVAIWQAAERLRPVPGRMQRLPQEDSTAAPTIVVDYAHTSDALENALTALREHLPGTADSQLWCVFGCGGDRDSGKRALMAAAAEKLADRLVITDDNPRSEDPGGIREQVLAGVTPGASERVHVIAGRRDAIEWTIQAAGNNDIVLIAGKGHETYQEIAGAHHAFSDVDVAEGARRLRKAAL